MIDRIDPKAFLSSRSPLSVSPKTSEASLDFRSLLEEKVNLSKPLELITIQLLNRALDALLSMNRQPDEETPFSLPSFPFNPPAIPSAAPQSPAEEKNLDGPQVSNNLQKKDGLDPIIEEAARTYGVEPELIRAVIEVESGGNPGAVSPAGAQGLMQLMPATGVELGVKDPFDPAQNIMAGTRYLRQLMDRYQGDMRLTLAAYNWGIGNLERHPEAMPKETQRYLVKVESRYRSQREASFKSSPPSSRIS